MSPLAALQRWSDAGGVWRVVGRTPSTATVSLCRCDGGEEVDRLTTDHPDAVAYLDRYPASEEVPG
jgi:hypothetical protein